jgi:hypothetical protein
MRLPKSEKEKAPPENGAFFSLTKRDDIMSNYEYTGSLQLKQASHANRQHNT